VNEIVLENRIFKYPLPINDDLRFTLDLPRGWKILTLDVQQEIPCLWIKVYPALQTEAVEFFWVPTGRAVRDEHNVYHRGSVQLREGYIVLHLFQVMR